MSTLEDQLHTHQATIDDLDLGMGKIESRLDAVDADLAVLAERRQALTERLDRLEALLRRHGFPV